MSPHAVNNFVSDLVLMAQAMEQLPKVQESLDNAEHENKALLEIISNLNVSFEASRTYASGLEQKVHDAEVARDDAELRFLELDEKTSKVSRTLLDIAVMAGLANAEIDPPKPEPIVEAKAETTTWDEAHFSKIEASPNEVSEQGMPIGLTDINQPVLERVNPIEEQGQSAADPTSDVVTGQDVAASPTTTSQSATSNSGADSPGPYSGRRYYDVPHYVNLSNWLDGGGTIEDYHWHPERKVTY